MYFRWVLELTCSEGDGRNSPWTFGPLEEAFSGTSARALPRLPLAPILRWVSFFGPAWSEPTLITLAYAFEQATRFRRKPDFRPTL